MAKRSAWKIVLIVFGVLILLSMLGVGVCIFSGVFWLKESVPAIQEAGNRAQTEAAQFAVGHTQSECIDEGFRRHDTCGAGIEMVCRTEARIFVDLCLQQATPTTGLCDGVPAPTAIMQTANWGIAYCREHGRANDRHCGSFIRALVDHCARR